MVASLNSARPIESGSGAKSSGVCTSPGAPGSSVTMPLSVMSGAIWPKTAVARSRSGTYCRKRSTPSIPYPVGVVIWPIRSHVTSVARSSQGCRTWRACSVPAIRPVMISDAGRPSSGIHHGACGQPSRTGSANAVPPSAGAVASSQPHAPATRSSSQTLVWCRMRRASSTAADWLAGARPSGSSAWPKPPSGLRYAATASRTGCAPPPSNSRS